MLATQQEVVSYGGSTITKETAVLATDGGGMVALEVYTLQAQNQQPSTPTYIPYNPPPVILPVSEPEPESCCESCWRCDDEDDWYSLSGKGLGWVFLLLLMYLVVGSIVLALALAYFALKCMECFLSSCDDDNSVHP